MKPVLYSVLLVVLAWHAPQAGADERKVTLVVPDMSCKACPNNVKRALSRVDGVKSVAIDHDAREAVVTFDKTKTTTEALIDVTVFAGYPATIKR